jgi:signal transduction histidine kinase/ligand-binding sensor domain-containing protein
MPGRLVIATLSILATFGLGALPADRLISQYVRRAWTVENGLPHGSARGIAQTKDGYLWIATYEGLVRFNGESFRMFDSNSVPRLSSPDIGTLSQGVDDTLWLGTFDGLHSYRDGVFRRIATPSNLGIIRAMTTTPDGSVWAGTSNGKIIHVVRGQARQVEIPLPASGINALATLGDDLWIGTVRGLFRYRQGHLDSWTTQNGLSSDTVRTLLADSGNVLLVGTARGLQRIEHGVLKPIDGIPLDPVTALRRDRDGNLWVGTYSQGLFRLAGRNVASYGIADGLLHPTIRSIFEDDEGNIWIGSQNGVEQLRAGVFKTWNQRHGLADDHARTVFEDRDGVLWLGTSSTLNRFEGGRWVDAGGDQLSQILSIEQGRDGTRWFGTVSGLFRVSKSGTTAYRTAQGLTNDTIRDVHEDRNGNVWIATDFGLNCIRADGTVQSFAGRGGLPAEYTMGITETPDGRIWVATGGGLGELRGSAFQLHASRREFPSSALFAIESDSEGTIWVATQADGVVRFRNGVAKTIASRHGLPTSKILSLVDDRRGNLWFGTVRGVFVASKAALNDAADGRRARVPISFFDENDGLGSRQINAAANPSAMRSRDGRIWFTTAHGLSVTTGTSLNAPMPHRAPKVEHVSVNGHETALHKLDSIAPGADRIELAFSSLTFTVPQRIRFRYRLEGYDDRWMDAGSSRVASYTKVPPGDYRFVIASSRDGVQWRQSDIRFRLQPHFYQTRWFLAACVATVMALFLLAHTIRLRVVKNRERLLTQLVEERTRQISEEKERTVAALREAERHERLTEQALLHAEEANRAKSIFLAATSHELRTPLNSIIGFSDILIDNAADKLETRHAQFLRNISSSGQYLLGIINNILDLSKIEAGRMEIQPELILVSETVDGICAVMKGVTTSRSITIDLDVDNCPPLEADVAMFKQILYNLMSNAMKFSPKQGTVSVRARGLGAEENVLGVNAIELRVNDNGIGIDTREQRLIFEEFRQAAGGRRQGTGLGLALVKRFVDLHGGNIRVESRPGEGSTFIVLLPRRQRKLAPNTVEGQTVVER